MRLAHITVNGEHYRTMINQYFFQNTDDINTNKMWMQQDGGTCYTMNETIDLLYTKFGDKSRNGCVNWSPRSCDLKPIDCIRWGYLKSLVCANKPVTLGALNANII